VPNQSAWRGYIEYLRDRPTIIDYTFGFFFASLGIGIVARSFWGHVMTFVGSYLLFDAVFASFLTIESNQGYLSVFGRWPTKVPPRDVYILFILVIFLSSIVAELATSFVQEVYDSTIPAPLTLVLWSAVAAAFLFYNLEKLFSPDNILREESRELQELENQARHQ
jgi:hypothetical protein